MPYNSMQLALSNKNSDETVAIILGYFNGRKYIAKQIESILTQSHQNLKVFIYDDCSDEALDSDMLNLETSDSDKISFKRNKSNLGFTNNFLNALSQIKDLSLIHI